MSKASRRTLKAPSPPETQPAEGTVLAANTALPPEETARYIAEISAELSFLARGAEFDLLAYLLDMARLEAIRALQVRGKK